MIQLVEKSFLFTVVLIFLNLQLAAQHTDDSTRVKQLMDEGLSALNNADYGQSITKYEEAGTLARELTLWRLAIKSENKILESLWRQYDLEKGMARAVKLKILVDEKLGAEDIEMGNLYHQIGAINILSGAFDSATWYFEKSIEIRSPYGDESWEGISAAYVNMGYIAGERGEADKQLNYYREAYEIDKKIYGSDHLYIAEDLSNIGSILIYRSRYASAIRYLNEALGILNKLENRGGIYTLVLANLGDAYTRMDEYGKAYDFQVQALRNNIKIFGEHHIDHKSIYASLARNLLKQNLLDSSLSYYKKALAFEDQLEQSNSSKLIFIWREIAFIYARKGDAKNALKYNSKAMRLAEKISNTSEFAAILHNNLGLIHDHLGNEAEAEASLEKAIALFKEDEISSKTMMAFTFRNLAEVQMEMGNSTKALVSIQQALENNHRSWKPENQFDNPDAQGAVNNENLLLALNVKSEILDELYDKNPSEEVLQSLLSTFSVMENAIRSENQVITRLDDKISFLEFTHQVYESAIRASLMAYEKHGDTKYLEACFAYSESDKAAILADALKNIDARNWSQVPDDLLSIEEELKADLSYYNSSLYDEKNKRPGPDSARMVMLETKLFELNHSLDSIRLLFEDKYPDYYQIMYEKRIPGVDDIRRSLGKKEALLEYFTGDSLSYLFLITRDEFLVKEIGRSEDIVEGVDKLRTIFKHTASVSSNFDPEEFITSSAGLYRKILSPVEEELREVDKLIIVPAGALNYIPFDILVQHSGQPPASLKELPWLLKKFQIRNAYSAGIDFSGITNGATGEREDVVCFAPEYEAGEAYEALASTDKLRSRLIPLEWNTREIQQIEALFDGRNYMNNEATERAFKASVADYKILHLAMHAFVDDEDPMNSRLVFTNTKDSVEDGFLHTFELFNMQINADLAVLSACETGSGKWIKGDGVFSLARAFAYAGVNSVVMSQWQVDDQSTSILMSYFYKYLSKGYAKPEALRSAKLDFLEHSDPNRAHPFYWGSFVMIGNPEPVFPSNNRWVLIAGAALLLLMVIIIFRRSRKQHSPT